MAEELQCAHTMRKTSILGENDLNRYEKRPTPQACAKGRRISAKEVILIALLLAPVFRPWAVNVVPDGWGLLVHRTWLFASFAIALVMLVRFRKISSPLFLVSSALFGWLLLSTVINGGNLWTWVDLWLTGWLATGIVIACWDEWRYELAYVVFLITTLFSLVNLLSMLLVPGGFDPGYHMYFGGSRNSVYQFAFPCVFAGLYVDGIRSRRMPLCFLLALLITVAQLVLDLSTTTAIALAFAIVVLALLRRSRIRSVLTSYIYLIGSVLTTLLVVVFRVQEHLGFIVTGLFGKSLTLSGRAPVWDFVMSSIDTGHLLAGRGVSGYQMIFVGGRQFYHTHNMYLELVFSGGLVALFLFIVLLLLYSRKQWKVRYSIYGSFSAAAIGSYFVVGITEPMLCSSFFLVVAFAYCLCSGAYSRRSALDGVCCSRFVGRGSGFRGSPRHLTDAVE